jgi:peptidoglycan/LPS O-acetylase OafA/YrhL/glycosyltransferase involved in cell wall biosynthesis
MEGLRGLAVLGVFIAHYDVLIRQRLLVNATVADICGVFGRIGTCGVDMFFVLSGFLIYRLVLQPQLQYASFVRRRAERIYPAFVAVFLFFVAVSCLVPSLSRIPRPAGGAARILLMNLAFLPGFVNIEPVVGVAWSLSYEWYFYLTLPFVIRALRMYTWTRAARLAFFALFCVIYLSVTFCLPAIGSQLHYPIYRSHIRLVMFVGGMITYDVLQARQKITNSFWQPFEWCIVAASLLGTIALFGIEAHYANVQKTSALLPQYEAYRTAVLLVICPSVVLCCSAFKGIFYKLLSVFELRWLGNISYSYYLAHTIGINAFRLTLLKCAVAKTHPHAALLLLLPFAFAASLASAIVLFVLVEKRFSVPRQHASPAPKPDLLRHGLEEIEKRYCTVIRKSGSPASAVELSVVIPNFNTAEYVIAAVNSVLTQTFERLEVIVVDDGSTDCSLQELERINDPRVTVVAQANRGLAGARNTGIILARGRYIGFLDSDDVWYPRKVEKQLAVMEANSEIGATFSYSAYISEDGAPTGQLLISSCKQPTARDLAFRNHFGNGSTPIIRRECFEEAGLFAEQLQACEDQEMWVRIAARTKWKLELIPEILTGYRVRSNSLSNSSYHKYVAQARPGIETISQWLPDLSRRDVDRCYAEFIRIISRKALSNGDIQISRALMIDALRYCPWLVLSDVRAMGLLVIHLVSLPLPRRFEMSIYQFSQNVMCRFYALFAAPSGSRELGQ